jgi:hypothetical protein
MEAVHPQTAEEIQAAAQTPEWQRLAGAYAQALKQRDALAALRAIDRVREKFGERMAEGLAEYHDGE